MKTKKEQIIEWGRKYNTPTKLTMDLLKRLRTQEQELTDKVYEFIGNHLKDDQDRRDVFLVLLFLEYEICRECARV